MNDTPQDDQKPRTVYETCQCPAQPGEPCPLSVAECVARIKAILTDDERAEVKRRMAECNATRSAPSTPGELAHLKAAKVYEPCIGEYADGSDAPAMRELDATASDLDRAYGFVKAEDYLSTLSQRDAAVREVQQLQSERVACEAILSDAGCEGAGLYAKVEAAINGREAAERERDEILVRVFAAAGIERTELALRWELSRGVEVQASGGPYDATRFIDLLTQARYVVDDLKRRESAAEGALARLREQISQWRCEATEAEKAAAEILDRAESARYEARGLALRCCARDVFDLLPPSEGAPKSGDTEQEHS